MKTKLERINEQLIRLRNQSNDDDLSHEIDNTIIHLEQAIEGIVQIWETWLTTIKREGTK